MISTSAASGLIWLIAQQFSDEQVQEIEELGFNPLKMYFGEDCVINEKITIHQPSIQDFIDSNSESDIYGVITPFVSNTTAYRLQLWSECCLPLMLSHFRLL